MSTLTDACSSFRVKKSELQKTNTAALFTLQVELRPESCEKLFLKFMYVVVVGACRQVCMHRRQSPESPHLSSDSPGQVLSLFWL